ncbi:MAG: hypothetical protein QM658_03195 [Gordonia sp. (in: high G+C Gram-positive bacteria)]
MTRNHLNFDDIEDYLVEQVVPSIKSDEGEHAALLFSVGEGHGAVGALLFGLHFDARPVPSNIAEVLRRTWPRTSANSDIYEPLDMLTIGPPAPIG